MKYSREYSNIFKILVNYKNLGLINKTKLKRMQFLFNGLANSMKN